MRRASVEYRTSIALQHCSACKNTLKEKSIKTGNCVMADNVRPLNRELLQSAML